MRIPRLLLILLAVPGAHLHGQQLRVSAPEAIGADHDFTTPRHAAIGPRGLLAVTQPDDAEVLIFDMARPDQPAATLGGRGSGPGEFQSVAHLGWVGDTLWVSDWARPRLEFFAAPTWSVTSQRMDMPRVLGPRWRFTSPIGYLTDSTLLHFPTRSLTSGPFVPTTMPILLARPNGAVTDTLALVRARDEFFCVVGDRSNGAAGSCAGQPLVSEDFIRVGRGSTWVLMILPHDRTTDATGPEVRVVRHDGSEVYSTSLGISPRRVTSAEWDSIVTVWSKSFAKDVWSTEARARDGLSEVLQRPDHYPVVEQALLGHDGVAWIGTHGGVGQRRWTLLGPTGATLGWLTLDAKIQLLDASATQAIGVRTDPDGVPELMRFEVRR